MCPCNIQTQASWTKTCNQESLTKISHFGLNKVASFGLEHQVAGKATRISSRSWNLESADVASILSGPLGLRLNWDERSSEVVNFDDIISPSSNQQYKQQILAVGSMAVLVLDTIIATARCALTTATRSGH